MATENQFLREHQQTYKSFIRWSAIFGAHILVILALLAIFRT
ncbi:MAG TPA: aa3-type cytochrome c oxidase subunit IV [Kiloniellales bacterium]|nr:aa3-type cytochrome c oxidase subunit IV [Kiloniellales bacterium]